MRPRGAVAAAGPSAQAWRGACRCLSEEHRRESRGRSMPDNSTPVPPVRRAGWITACTSMTMAHGPTQVAVGLVSGRGKATRTAGKNRLSFSSSSPSSLPSSPFAEDPPAEPSTTNIATTTSAPPNWATQAADSRLLPVARGFAEPGADLVDVQRGLASLRRVASDPVTRPLRFVCAVRHHRDEGSLRRAVSKRYLLFDGARVGVSSTGRCRRRRGRTGPDLCEACT